MAQILYIVMLFALEIVHGLRDNCDFFMDSNGLNVLECHQKFFHTRIAAKAEELHNTDILHIKCGGKVLQESWLKSLTHNETSKLKKIIIEFCEVGQAHKTSTEIRNQFENLEHLEQLILINNNFWSLPQGILCNFNHLKQLSLSSNHILDVANVGLKTDLCKEINVDEIDMSSNFIASIGPETFGQISKVKKIQMANNLLSVLSGDSFQKLPELRDIDLANNQLSELPPRIFQSNALLENLSLQNNSLRIISQDIFKGLDHLRYLNLSHNSLTSSAALSSLTQIEILDISHNRLTELDVKLFSKFSALRELFLGNNLIHTIQMDSSKLGINLQVVDLSYNKLSYLGKIFEEASKLKVLKVDNNMIQDLESFVLTCESLIEVSLHQNQLITVPKFLKECKQLQALDLSYNKIGSLSSSAFSGIRNLINLNLGGNQIATVSNKTFANISSELKTLNLANNRIENIERLAFVGLTKLSNLRLDGNQLTDLNGLLSHLTSLHHLNVSSNRLEWFDYAFIPSSLTWLDISHNKIGTLGNFYNLKNFQLETLFAGHNSIQKLEPDSLLQSLGQVRLDNNLISKVEADTFAKMPNLQLANLQHNQIHHLEPESLKSSPENVQGKHYEIFHTFF